MVNTYHCALKYYRRKSVPVQFVKKSFWWTAFTSCACGILFVHFPSSQGSWSVSTPLNNLHRDLTFGHSCLLLVANTFTDLLHLEKQGACWRCQKSILTTDKFEGKKKTKQTSQVSPKEERCTKKLFSPKLIGILRLQKKENQKETRSKRHLTDSTLTTGAVVFKQTSPIFHRAGPLENSSNSGHLFRFANLVPPFWLKQKITEMTKLNTTSAELFQFSESTHSSNAGAYDNIPCVAHLCHSVTLGQGPLPGTDKWSPERSSRVCPIFWDY